MLSCGVERDLFFESRIKRLSNRQTVKRKERLSEGTFKIHIMNNDKRWNFEQKKVYVANGARIGLLYRVRNRCPSY